MIRRCSPLRTPFELRYIPKDPLNPFRIIFASSNLDVPYEAY